MKKGVKIMDPLKQECNYGRGLFKLVGPYRWRGESWSSPNDAYDRMRLCSRRCAIGRMRLRFRVFTSLRSPHSGVARPLDLCHFARLNVDLEWATWLGKAVFRQRYSVVAWAKRKSEAPFTICCKRCNRAFLVRDRKNRIWKRRLGRSLRFFPNRSGPDRTDRNDSLDSRTLTRFGFSRGRVSVHKQEERKNQRDVVT